ncbi:MAG: endonuclease VIII [Pseudomonadota bacterium]
MPEGPEIRREADAIAAAVAGTPLSAIDIRVPTLKRFARRLATATVVAVEARGKALLTRFDNDLTLYSHNQLYGRWVIARRGHEPATNRSLRIALHGPSQSALLYSASDISVLTDAQLAKHPFLKKLGPDVLNQPLTASDVADRLQLKPFAGRRLGALYLDQSFLAGLGNYLRSEILFTSRLHPLHKAGDLSRRAAIKLARETLKLPTHSYETAGLTVPKSRANAARRRGLDFEERRFWVFGREGQPCHVCGTPIERIENSGRRVYMCPSCQPLP